MLEMRREEVEMESSSGGGEYEVEHVRDKIQSSRASRLELVEGELGFDSLSSNQRRRFSRQSVNGGLKKLRHGVVHPDDWWYPTWEKFILIWAVYSTFFTPMEFGFFRGLPRKLLFLDLASQTVFLVDVFLNFFLAYRDSKTYRMVYSRKSIAIRYLKSYFILDFLSCMPWDLIYKAVGRKEIVRYLLWTRLIRVRMVHNFMHKMEKDIRLNYLFTRIVKLLAVELYCTHTAACIIYYLATTMPSEKEGYTWIGSLRLGDNIYTNFRDIDLWKRYITSLYFAIVTMATVGYGDIHAVNVREMIFMMIFISFDMILGAYLIGNMTALIVKGSKTEKYRDKMTDLMRYVNRNRLGRDIRSQIKGHLRLKYESGYTEAAVIQDLPISIRAKISRSLYKSYIENVALFKGCSAEFINQIVMRVHEEFFLPGEVVMEQGYAVDQLYFVCHGVLEEIGIGQDGFEETVSLLETYSAFGIISVLCNIPQPFTVRVCELCRLLRIDKQSFSNILDVYFQDGRKIMANLEGQDSNFRLKQLETDTEHHIGKQEGELALKLNSAAYHGDLQQFKNLIRAGADPKGKDYDGRSPLHLAASRGHKDIVHFLIQEGVEINVVDDSGNTPFLEAVKNGHEGVCSALVKADASLKIENAGTFLCMVVARGGSSVEWGFLDPPLVVAKGDSSLLKRLLSYGIDPNSRDYDERTPLHLAASQGLLLMAKMLLEAGASLSLKDRFGNTPLDEARICGNKNLMNLLEAAIPSQISECTSHTKEIIDKKRAKKCTVFPCHPWEAKDVRKFGVVLWVPHSIEELIREASMQLNSLSCCCILTEDGGKILDINMISDGQRLYLMSDETQ